MGHQIRSYHDSTFRNLQPSENIWGEKTLERELAYLISSKTFENIYEFPYVYFISGITEGINYFANKHKIIKHPNEYRYLNLFLNVSNKSGDIAYQSYPFSGDGRFHSIRTDKPVILDCAYMFASNMQNEKVLPSNVDTVMFSLSKSHNLSDYRIAWMFSKNKIPEYHVLQYDNNYSINSYVLSALKTINDRPLNYLYTKYKEQFSNLYSLKNLTENDVNLFALDNKNNRLPFYILE